MDHLPFIREVFPFRTEQEILNIIEIVGQANPGAPDQDQLGLIYDMLSGDEGPVEDQIIAQPTQENVEENVEVNVLQGQVENEGIDDELLEGAVGYGHAAPVNNAVLNGYFNNLQSIFPDAAPDYLWDLCHKRGAQFNLNDVVDEITQNGYDRIVLDANAIWERLKDALPGWDPSYLKIQSQKLAFEDPVKLEQFVNSAIENNEYPTMEQYLKRKKEQDNINSYKEAHFKLDKFLETFPNPERHFKDPNRPNPLEQENIAEQDVLYAKTFLYNRYADIRKRHVDLVFKMKKMRLLDCCDMLDGIKKGLKIKRIEEVMPDCNNLPLLQEIIYIKHRRLIRRVLKYKDDTNQKFREEARALNLLVTCAVCEEDELIPEECFNCPKGCMFCQGCVKKYIEVRMGDGQSTFPCCNCDSEFSLHILQMALPKHLFERLVLKIQSEEIKRANIEGLETCPFCDFASIPPEESTIFKCENAECLKESCRLCRHESHIPKRCNEIEYDEDVRRRTYIENIMTEALARTCPKCSKKFIKSTGCNKMTCTCGTIMCYLCSQVISGYDHFGEGKTCDLFTNDNRLDLNRVRERAERAKQELGNVEIKFDPTVGIENFFQGTNA